MKNTKIDFKKAQEDILGYLKLLLEKKGMVNLPPEILSEMLLDLHSRFDNYLFASVMQGLNEEGYKKIDEFIESDPKTEELMKFLQDNVPEIDQLIENARGEFEKIYLGEK
ncbi:MAG: hypothetical protein COT31_03805 [Candidatus Moranbacteria bacterium CG08_land_8_20_14_0_20_34_16]|nr:MAG: hypothetical protein COT31_03805 [Candidatus Moranbacteria bacterium CG08_land_8_20_14_0_20_34_16]